VRHGPAMAKATRPPHDFTHAPGEPFSNSQHKQVTRSASIIKFRYKPRIMNGVADHAGNGNRPIQATEPPKAHTVSVYSRFT
jgi:hypothetical protein